MSAAERYPLAEHDPERVRSRSGRTLGDFSVEAIVAGEVAIEDLGDRARWAARAGRGRPRRRPADAARNFERAAELVTVPEALLLQSTSCCGRAGPRIRRS